MEEKIYGERGRTGRTKRRVFVAINLPQELKDRIGAWQKTVWDFPVRWIRPENLHLTLVFIGWTDSVVPAQEAVAAIASRFVPPELCFTYIDYGPPEGPPRMFWLYGEPNQALMKLKSELEDEFIRQGILSQKEARELALHITVGRMREYEWRKKIGRERPEAHKTLSFRFRPRTLDLMESHLRKSGAEYEILCAAPFGLAER